MSFGSCDLCRSIKTKCDRAVPSCTRCLKQNQQCTYYASQRRKKPCAPCQKIRKKCSNEHPSCSLCLLKGKQCYYENNEVLLQAQPNNWVRVEPISSELTPSFVKLILFYYDPNIRKVIFEGGVRCNVPPSFFANLVFQATNPLDEISINYKHIDSVKIQEAPFFNSKFTVSKREEIIGFLINVFFQRINTQFPIIPEKYFYRLLSTKPTCWVVKLLLNVICLAALTLFPKNPLSVGMKKSFADFVFLLLPLCYTSPSYPLLYSYIILACISPQDFFHEKAKPQLFYLGHVGIIYFMLGLHNSRGAPQVSRRLEYFRDNVSATVQLLESLLSTYAMNRQAAINFNFLEDVALWRSSTRDVPLKPSPCQSIDPFIEPKRKLAQQTWIKNLWAINYQLAATHGEIQSSMPPKDGSKQNANVLSLANSLKLAEIEKQLHLLGMGIDLKEGFKAQPATKIQAPKDPNCTHNFILYLGIIINIYCPYISMSTLEELDISYEGHSIVDFVNYIPEQKVLIAVWHFCDAIRIHQSHFVATGLFYKWMNILNVTFILKHLSKSLPVSSLAAKRISACIDIMMSFLELGKARSHVARLSYEITLKVSSDKKVRIQILPNLCNRG